MNRPAGAGPWPPPNRPGSLAGETARAWRWTNEAALEELKGRMLREVIAGVMTPALVTPLRRAANEAAAIAWLEPWPLLVFPGLFEEKVALARRRAHKQAIIHSRSAALLYQEAA
ncbi:MAG: hypothetical protein ACKOET_19020 [Verrucomicrobiota bacterium]